MKKIIKRALEILGYRLIRKDQLLIPDSKWVALLNAFAEVVRKDYLHSLPQLSREQALRSAELTGISEAQAFYLLDALCRCIPLPGDVCEFGVAQGATSALIAESILASEKRLWLFDSFEGLSAPTEKDVLQDDVLGLGSIDEYTGQMSFPESMVRKRLRSVNFPHARLEIVKGFVEASLSAGRVPKQVAFAFVDLDFYEPIRRALQFLDGVLAPEGVIVVHDYGFLSTGAKTAVDEFLQESGDRFAAHFPSGPIAHCCSLQRNSPRTSP